MLDALFEVDVRCLNCRAVVLRTEAAPGEDVEMPNHECGA